MSRLILTITLLLSITTVGRAQTLRYFQFNTYCGHGRWQDSSFIAATSDAIVIGEVIEELSKPLGERKIMGGPIVAGNGGYNHNADHWFKWRFKESEWKLAEMAMEVCDGCPYSDIDTDPEYWLNTVREYCPWSSQPVREVPQPTSLEDVVSLENDLVIFPNPAGNVLNFKWSAPSTINVYIINTMGVAVRTATMYQALPRLDISELPGGIYFLKIIEGNRSVSRTIEVKK